MTIGNNVSFNTAPSLAANRNEGALNNRNVSPTKTDPSAERLAQREELAHGHGLLERLSAALTTLVNMVTHLLGLSETKSQTFTPLNTQNPTILTADQKTKMNQVAIQAAVNAGLAKTTLIDAIKAEDLAANFTQLASGSGALRSLTTALEAVKRGSDVNAVRTLASALLNTKIAGESFQQWGTAVGAVKTWLENASPEELKEATQQLKELLTKVTSLQRAANHELEGKRSLANSLALSTTYEDFKPGISAFDAFHKLKPITQALLAGQTVVSIKEDSKNGAFESRFVKLPLVKSTLVKVDTPEGPIAYNANYVRDGKVIASHAPIPGKNTEQFADLIVQLRPTVIVDLTTTKDKNIAHYSHGGVEAGRATFEKGEKNGSFTELNVTGTTGETVTTEYINVAIPDFEGGDIQKLHTAVLEVNEKMEEFGGNFLVHCRAGVGRTGEFIMLGKILELYKSGALTPENHVEMIAKEIIALRKERCEEMVQSKEQVQALFQYYEGLNSGDLKIPDQRDSSPRYENSPEEHVYGNWSNDKPVPPPKSWIAP